MHWFCSGDVLFKKYFSDPASAKLPAFSFFNPSGTEWLVPQVRQFKPDWPTDPDTDLDKFVMPESSWVFAPEATTPVEWVPTTRAGHAGASANKWISTTIPQTGFTDIGFTNWTKFKAAAGVKLPTGFGRVAGCAETPTGLSLTEAEYTPFMQWLSFPGDQDLFAFGWQDMALLVYHGIAHVLQRTGTDDWKLLNKGPASEGNSPHRSGSFISSTTLISRNVAVLPIGLNSLNFYFGGAASDPLHAKVRDVKINTPAGLVFGVGDGGSVVLYPAQNADSWWVAAAPGQHLNFQAQVLGYSLFGGPPISSDLTAPHFDTGEQYKPTIAPKFGGQIVFRSTLGNQCTVSTDPDGQKNFALLADSQTASLQVHDETYLPWVSDGTHHAGYAEAVLGSGSPGGFLGAWYYLAPQIRLFELQFPVKLVDRECTPLTLDDTKFMGAEGSASLQEAAGKRATIRLFAKGAHAFQTAGFDRRSEYPFHWMRDTDGDGIPDQIIFAGQIINSQLTQKFIKSDGKQVGYYELPGEGLLHVADNLPVLLPQMVNPDGAGKMEHTYCVREALRSSGIDVTDSARLFISVDPYAGTAVSQMPGYWAQAAGANAVKADSVYAMDWQETFLQYCARLAATWSAWNFYEGMAQRVNYHPDLMTDLLGVYGGATYYVTCPIYATKAAAAAALVPGQYYLSEPRTQIIDPVANVVRVTGKDTEGFLLPTLYEQDTLSLTDTTYENHLGYRKVHASETKLAVSTESMRQICHIMLQLLRQRQFIVTVDVPLAYDQMGLPGEDMAHLPIVTPANLDVGYVVSLEHLGDYRVIHLKDTGVTSRTAGGYHVTTLTCQKMPAGSLAGTAVGRWPGVGA
jgi:hypothetical protein